MEEQPYPKRHWTAAMNRHWEHDRKATAQYERADAALTKAKREADKLMARFGPNHEDSKAATRKVQAAQQKADSVVHELGHEIEDQPGVKEATAAFLKRRCGKEKATRIRDVYPDDVEIPQSIRGRKDEFDRYFEGTDAYYVGRKYKGGSTEIISMGLQAVYNDPAGLAKADPDYFDFIVDILAGKHNERVVSG